MRRSNTWKINIIILPTRIQWFVRKFETYWVNIFSTVTLVWSDTVRRCTILPSGQAVLVYSNLMHSIYFHSSATSTLFSHSTSLSILLSKLLSTFLSTLYSLSLSPFPSISTFLFLGYFIPALISVYLTEEKTSSLCELKAKMFFPTYDLSLDW